MTSKPLVIVTRRLPELVEARMMELFNTRLSSDDKPLDKQQLIEAVKEADILVPTVTDKIDSKIINQASDKLKLIANFGNGVDHIDINTALKKKIIVTNTPGVLTEDTADMVMSLLLAVPRKIIEGEKLIRSGLWKGWSPTHMMGRRIWGKRLGIIGMGSIGQAVARRAKGFGLNIHYHNRNKLPDIIEDSLDATYWEDLDQMLPKMDILSINCPSTSETFHLLSRERLSSLQAHAYIINTSRGDIVNEKHLIEFLMINKKSKYATDVLANEVIENKIDNPIINFAKINNQVIITPHIAGMTVEGQMLAYNHAAKLLEKYIMRI